MSIRRQTHQHDAASADHLLTALAVELGVSPEDLGSALQAIIEHEKRKRAEAAAAEAEAARAAEAHAEWVARMTAAVNGPTERVAQIQSGEADALGGFGQGTGADYSIPNPNDWQ